MKKIKAVELVRRIRDEHQELLRGKSPEERAAFYREKADQLHEKLGRRKESKKGAQRG